MRFHLDENMAPAVANALRRRGIDVTTTADAELRGVEDEVQLAFATSQQRVVITSDPDFLVLAASGQQHTGIVLFLPAHRTIGQLIEHLLLIDGCMSVEEMCNHIEFC